MNRGNIHGTLFGFTVVVADADEWPEFIKQCAQQGRPIGSTHDFDLTDSDFVFEERTSTLWINPHKAVEVLAKMKDDIVSIN